MVFAKVLDSKLNNSDTQLYNQCAACVMEVERHSKHVFLAMVLELYINNVKKQ